MPTLTFMNLPEDKKKRILDAAVHEFGRRSLQESNLSNIVKEAGISRGSIYQYFKTKDDLYVYIFDTLRGERAQFVKPAYDIYKKEPFLAFFEMFYLRDSEYLIEHPAHIELGKRLYSAADATSMGLIRQLQNRYKNLFLVGIEFDKERGLISRQASSDILADLCVHFVTDIFIFQSVHTQFTLANIRQHCRQTLHIIQNGIKAT